jgi:hypothetical protein
MSVLIFSNAEICFFEVNRPYILLHALTAHQTPRLQVQNHAKQFNFAGVIGTPMSFWLRTSTLNVKHALSEKTMSTRLRNPLATDSRNHLESLFLLLSHG